MLTPEHLLTAVDSMCVSFAVQDYSPHSVMVADMNRGLPPMSTFHRNNIVPRNASVNTSENSTGEEMGNNLHC